MIGLTILSTQNAFAKRMLVRLEQKYPDAYAKVEGLKQRFARSKLLLITLGTILIVLLVVGIYLAVMGLMALYGELAPILMK